MPPRVSPLSVAFGRVLRQRRRLADLSQEKLAHLSGLDRTYISKLERGQVSPSFRVLEQLSKVLEEAPHLLVKAAEEIPSPAGSRSAPPTSGTLREDGT